MPTKEDLPPANERDLADARSLFFRAKTKRKLRNHASSWKKWAGHLAAIHCVDLVPEEEVHRVLAWHVSQIGEDFCVEAYSGESVRSRYEDIKRAYDRQKSPPVEVSEPAAKIAERVRLKGWPVPVKSLPAAVQNSITFMEVFRARLVRVQETFPKPEEGSMGTNHRVHKLCDLLLQENHLTWVENWWEHARRQALKWPNFDGRLQAFAMKVEDPWFQKWLNGVSRARFGTEKGDLAQEELERELAK